MSSGKASTTIDETPNAALISSVMDELHLDADPPEDEYAGELPPAYNTFEVAYEHWIDTDKAKQAMMALDHDPAIRAAETELKKAKQLLKELQATSKELFETSKKRNSFKFHFGFGKSNRMAHVGHSPVTEMFKRAHEAEVKQELVVNDLVVKVEEFKHKRQTLNDIASGSNPSWNRLCRIAEGTLYGRGELVVPLGEGMEKLEGVENGYNAAKKTATDLTRACQVVQHAHHYFTRALKICDDVRGTSTGRSVMGTLGGGDGIIEMTKKIQYQDSVKMAGKAQICLNEMYRVMEPHEHMLPADRMEDYEALKKLGLMQMSKIYNLMWGGSFLADGVAGTTKRVLDQQEAAFAHLTPLAVWIQNRVPACMIEKDLAENLRDDVRREVAAAWYANSIIQ